MSELAKCIVRLLFLSCVGLTGCVYGFEEDGRTSAENQFTGGVNVVNCESTICRFSLCSNGASCVLDQADAKGYTCNCTEVGWHGNLEYMLHVVRFHLHATGLFAAPCDNFS